MELENSFTVPAGIDAAWTTLLDVERVAPCMPGATLTGVDGDEVTGTVRVKVGPIVISYSGRAVFRERDQAAHTVVLEASGKETKAAGTASATVRAELHPVGENETNVVVRTELTVTGRPARFGRGVISDVATKLIGEFADSLAAEMSATPAARIDDLPAGQDAVAQSSAPVVEKAEVAHRPTSTRRSADSINLVSTVAVPIFKRALRGICHGLAALFRWRRTPTS